MLLGKQSRDGPINFEPCDVKRYGRAIGGSIATETTAHAHWPLFRW